MDCFRKILLILIAMFFLPLQVFAQWQDLCAESPFAEMEGIKVCKKGYTQVRIDLDSVNYHNNSIYYAIEYVYFKNIKENVHNVSIVQNKGNQAGIVSTFAAEKYKQYQYQKLVRTAGNAKVLKVLSPDSILYDATLMAQKTAKQKETQRREEQKRQNYYEAKNDLF